MDILLDILLKPPQPLMGLFLGGFSLHLNQLIASCAQIMIGHLGHSFWTFWVKFGTRDLQIYPRTYFGHF